MDDTEHVHGCTYPECGAQAVTRVEFWRDTFGWQSVGDFCAKHAVQAGEGIDLDSRKVPV